MHLKNMTLALGLLLSAVAAPVMAAPDEKATEDTITEITLQDTPGFVRPPYKINKIVLRSNGASAWTTGLSDNPREMKGLLKPSQFKRLVDLLQTQKFLDMPQRFNPEPMISDGGGVLVTATQDGKTKTVFDYIGSGPASIWTIEMVIRGVASQVKWEDGTPSAK